MPKYKNGFLICLLGTLFVLLLTTTSVTYSFIVSSIPSDNLISNPWFRDASDPSFSGLDGWIDAAEPNKYWSSSQKQSNPTPEIIVSGVCGFEPVYCGTAARLSPTPGESGGLGKPGVDAYLYQVVSANSNDRKLVFFAHWVSHRIDPAKVVIYGGDSASGPWTAVWTPFYHVQDTNPPPPSEPSDLWQQTGFLEFTSSKGYSFYKVQIHARLPDTDVVGFKITGIYFVAKPTTAPPPPPPFSNSIYLPLIVKNESAR